MDLTDNNGINLILSDINIFNVCLNSRYISKNLFTYLFIECCLANAVEHLKCLILYRNTFIPTKEVLNNTIFDICELGNIETLKYIDECFSLRINYNYFHKYYNNTKTTILINVCKNNNVEVLNFLRHKNINVNARNTEKQTALMVCCGKKYSTEEECKKQLEIVKILLEMNANINANINYYINSLYLAIYNDNNDIIDLIINSLQYSNKLLNTKLVQLIILKDNFRLFEKLFDSISKVILYQVILEIKGMDIKYYNHLIAYTGIKKEIKVYLMIKLDRVNDFIQIMNISNNKIKKKSDINIIDKIIKTYPDLLIQSIRVNRFDILKIIYSNNVFIKTLLIKHKIDNIYYDLNIISFCIHLFIKYDYNDKLLEFINYIFNVNEYYIDINDILEILPTIFISLDVNNSSLFTKIHILPLCELLLKYMVKILDYIHDFEYNDDIFISTDLNNITNLDLCNILFKHICKILFSDSKIYKIIKIDVYKTFILNIITITGIDDICKEYIHDDIFLNVIKEVNICDICFETKINIDFITLLCNHKLCKTCFNNLLVNTCPFCRSPI